MLLDRSQVELLLQMVLKLALSLLTVAVGLNTMMKLNKIHWIWVLELDVEIMK